MQPEIWIGTVEISFADPATPTRYKRAFTVITTWACTFEEFRKKTDRMLRHYGWRLLSVETARPAPDDATFTEEVEDTLERTRRNPAAVIYGTFHKYPLM